MNNNQPSALLRSLSRFANCLAGICLFLFLPQIAQYIRPDMQSYLATHFPHDFANYGSWGFCALLAACGYFGLTALFQVLMRLLFQPRIKSSGI